MDLVLPGEAVASKPKKKLLDQVRDMMRLKHYSPRTERTYSDWIARSENVSTATQNQALSALLFLYKEVLRQKIGWLENVERAARYCTGVR